MRKSGLKLVKDLITHFKLISNKPDNSIDIIRLIHTKKEAVSNFVLRQPLRIIKEKVSINSLSLLFFRQITCNTFLRCFQGFIPFFPVGGTNFSIFLCELKSVDYTYNFFDTASERHIVHNLMTNNA